MGKKLLLLFLLVTFSAQTQVKIEHNDLFSEVIRLNVKKYTRNSQMAYAYRDFERAEFLYDSLINNVIKGSYLDNFEVRKLSGRKIELYKFKKPTFLITYSSWCVPADGEIPSLNKIAKKYSKQVDFVVLFWDNRTNAKKASRKYSRKVNIVYVDETENTNNHIVERMKHSLGLPTSFLIDKEKRIKAVGRGATQVYSQDSQISPQESIYKYFLNGVSTLTTLKDEDRVLLNSLESSGILGQSD